MCKLPVGRRRPSEKEERWVRQESTDHINFMEEHLKGYWPWYCTPLAETTIDGEYKLMRSAYCDDHILLDRLSQHLRLEALLERVFQSFVKRPMPEICKMILDEVFPKYVEWTLKGIRNAEYDYPVKDYRPEAKNLQDCLQLIRPHKVLSFVTDRNVCIAKMLEDLILGVENGRYKSHGLDRKIVFDTIPHLDIYSAACHLWPHGLYATPSSDGYICISSEECPKGPNPEDNEDMAMFFMVVEKSVTFEQIKTNELVNSRLFSESICEIYGFEKNEVFFHPDEHYLVVTAPHRLRYSDDDVQEPATQQQIQFSETDSTRTDYDFTVDQVWEAQVVPERKILEKLSHA